MLGHALSTPFLCGNPNPMKHILSSVAAQRGAKPLIVGAVLAGVALLFVQAATVSPSGFDPAADYPDASGLTITDANDLSDDQSYTYTTAARSSSSVHTSASAHGAQNAEVNPRAANGESAATPRAPRAAHANTPARADRDAPRQLAQAGGRNSIAAARSLSAVASPRAGSTHVSSSDSPASGGHGSSNGAGGGGPVGSNNAQGESQRPAKAEPASERHAASVNQSGANDIKSDTADSLVAPPSTETAFEPLPSLTEATTAGIDPENAIGP